MSGLKPKYQDLIKQIISKYLDQYTLILFGSRAGDNYKFCSDLDLAIDYSGINKEKLDINLAYIREDIEESILPYEVDLVDLNSVSSKFKALVLENGIVLHG